MMIWREVFNELLEQGAANASGSMYVYARIVEILKTAIKDGRMKVGDRLPTLHYLLPLKL
jgi:DNA-binding GntR family transcriptional regulator